MIEGVTGVLGSVQRAPTIRGVVQTGPRQLQIQTFERPRIGRDDAILRVEVCGICGTDVEQYTGKVKWADYPFVPGHEPLGIIEEIGDRAALKWGVQVGDRVAVEPLVTCGVCEHCLSGSRTTCGHTTMYGFTATSQDPGVWGAYAESMYLHRDSVLHKVDKNLPAEIAAIYNPLAAGVRWATNAPSLHMGDTVVILGAGQRGLASVIASKAAGAGKIIVTDIARASAKLDLAMELGATHVIVADKENAVEQVASYTNGRLADVVVEVTGATQPVSDSIDMVRRGGTIVLAGIKGMGVLTNLETDKLVRKSITLRGVYTVDSKSYVQAIQLIQNSAVPFAKMHSGKYGLHRVEEAIHRLAGWDGKPPAVHIVIDPLAV